MACFGIEDGCYEGGVIDWIDETVRACWVLSVMVVIF